MSKQTYDFTKTLEELDGGTFNAKVSSAIQDAALGTAEHGRKSTVVIELTVERIGESRQVTMTHKLKASRPTMRGKTSQEDTTATPLYVSKSGALSIAPENQVRLFAESE